MRFLWLAHRDIRHPHAGGAERSIDQIGRRLVARGHQVTLLSGGWRGSSLREIINGVDVRRLWTPLGPHLLERLALTWKDPPDLTVADLGHVVPWTSILRRSRHGIVFFHHLHSRTLPLQVPRLVAPFFIASERLYGPMYKGRTFVTESVQSVSDLVGLGVEQRLIRRIPPGVDWTLFSPRPKTDSPTIVYFTGMRTYKRPVDVLLAFSLVRRSVGDAQLRIVGVGPELPNLKALANRLGVARSVEFVGHLQDRELANLVGSSWIHVVSSHAEGWCFSASEATAAGVPTIAYSVPGLRESVLNGETGCLVPESDIPALAEAAVKVLQKPGAWWSRCEAHARDLDWDRTVDSWMVAAESALDR